MIIGVVTFLAITYAYLAYYNLRFAVAGLILLLPSYLIRFSIFGIPFTFLEVMIIILFVFWLIHEYQKNKKIFKDKQTYVKFLCGYIFGYSYKKFATQLKRSTFSSLFQYIQKPILFFLLAGLLSVSVAPDFVSAAGILKAYIIEPILFLLVFINVINKDSDFYFYVEVLGITSLLISSFAVLQFFTRHGVLIENYAEGTFMRVTSFFEYPNAIGLIVMPILGLLTPYVYYLLTSFKNRNIKKGLLFSGIIIVGIIAVILSKTEAALVAYAVVMLGFLLYKNWWTRFFAGLIVLLCIVGSTFFPDGYNMIKSKIMLQDFSGQIRIHTYTETVTMLKDHAIFGTGLTGYQETMKAYHQDVIWIGDVLQPVEIYLYPHNIFLNFWVELGILGVFVMIYILIKIIRNLVKKHQNILHQMVLFSFAIVFIHGLVDVPFFKNDLAVIWWIIIGLGLYSMENSAKIKKI